MARATNIYKCDSCGWIYDPVQHGGRELDDQLTGWACPQCQAERDHFQLVVPREDDLVTPDDERGATLAIDIAKERPLFTRGSDPDVSTLYNRYKKGRLDVRPDFQRYDVWTLQKKSRLIESVLLRLPIPIIYLAQEPDESSIVIDGQQRLLALFQFYEGQYKLDGTKVLTNQNGKRFKELDSTLQEAIEGFQLTVVEILKESNPEIKFDLFERLNTGATQLNDQELRNSVHRGPYNELIRELAGHDDFRTLIGLKEPHKRMVDVELVLRFMAFYEQTYLKHPDKKTTEFLNEQMKRGAAATPKQREKAADAFRQATALALTVFGKEAFRPFAPGDAEGPIGKWERRPNRALMDVQLYGFTQHGKGAVTKRSDAIREMAVRLMSSSQEFNDLISHTISEKKRVKRRFEIWLQHLDAVMKGAEQGHRAFDPSVRRELFARRPVCAQCSQQIHVIDDAVVDHQEPFAKGGKTGRANANLMHRYCNAKKGARDVPRTRATRRRAAG